MLHFRDSSMILLSPSTIKTTTTTMQNDRQSLNLPSNPYNLLLDRMIDHNLLPYNNREQLFQTYQYDRKKFMKMLALLLLPTIFNLLRFGLNSMERNYHIDLVARFRYRPFIWYEAKSQTLHLTFAIVFICLTSMCKCLKTYNPFLYMIRLFDSVFSMIDGISFKIFIDPSNAKHVFKGFEHLNRCYENMVKRMKGMRLPHLSNMIPVSLMQIFLALSHETNHWFGFNTMSPTPDCSPKAFCFTAHLYNHILILYKLFIKSFTIVSLFFTCLDTFIGYYKSKRPHLPWLFHPQMIIMDSVFIFQIHQIMVISSYWLHFIIMSVYSYRWRFNLIRLNFIRTKQMMYEPGTFFQHIFSIYIFFNHILFFC